MFPLPCFFLPKIELWLLFVLYGTWYLLVPKHHTTQNETFCYFAIFYVSVLELKVKHFAILPVFTYRYLKLKMKHFCHFASFYVSVLETENEAFLLFCQFLRVGT